MFPTRPVISLQYKLLAPFVVAVLAAALGIHFIWLPSRIVEVREDFQTTQQSMISVLSPALIGFLLGEDTVQAHAVLDLVKKKNSVWVNITLTDVSGSRIYPFTAAPELAGEGIVWFDEPLAYRGTPLGRLKIGADSAQVILAEANRVRRFELGLLMLLMLTAGSIAILQRRSILAPLEKLARAADRLAQDDFADTLPSATQDEMGRLVEAFDAMREKRRVSDHMAEQAQSQRAVALRQAEKSTLLLQESITSIAQGFTIYDENDRLVLCNEAYLCIYEASRDVIVPGNSFEEIVRVGAERGQYTEAIGRVDDWVRERVAGHQNASGEVIEQELGDGRWLMIVEFRTPSGFIVGNRVDITALKHATFKLALSEQRWALAARGANDGIWDWSTQTGIVYFSDRWKTMLGYEPHEITDNLVEWRSRIHAQDYERVMARLQVHLRGESGPYEVEHRLRCKDGSDKWILARGQALFDASGQSVRMAGSHTDITEQRRIEEGIRDRTEQLNAIFSLSPDGFVSFDLAKRVKYVSPAFLRLTGLAEEDVLRIDEAAFSERLSLVCQAQSRFRGFAALRASQPGAEAERRTVIALVSAGQRVVEVRLRLSNTDTVSQILYFRDITHETEVDRMKSEFLSTAAHELRTPLASIFGFSELLLTTEFTPEERNEYLGIIHKQGGLMTTILNELLDLSRIESRRGLDFKIVDLEMHVLLDEVAAGYKTSAARAAPTQPSLTGARWLRGDRGKLIQAVSNVLSNAYKYSPKGGPVEIELLDRLNSDAAPELGIRISDHGIGMTTEQLARVCERFYRADASGKIPGTGLGMSIVKEITELHGGHIEITSVQEVGTSVTLWMPAGSPPCVAA